MVSTHAGDLIGEIALAIEMVADIPIAPWRKRTYCAPMARTLSQSPMIAPHGTVTHGPNWAKHLHNLHQA
jgi:hypothetical protein